MFFIQEFSSILYSVESLEDTIANNRVQG